MIKRYILFLFIVGGLSGLHIHSNRLNAQDPHFSQFYANPLYLNPAFAGTNVCPRVIMNYRNQWTSIPGAFVTYNAGYDQYFQKIQGGIGAIVMSDRAGEGALTYTSAGLMYAYHLPVGRAHNINFSLQGTYYNKSLDWDKLTFGDMIDAKEGFIYQTNDSRPSEFVSYVDFSAGMLYYTENFYAGFAAHHLTEPENSLYGGMGSSEVHYRKYTAHAGLRIPLTPSGRFRAEEDPYLFPAVIYMQQHTFHQMNLGLYFQKTPIVVGAWFRNFIKDPAGGGMYDAVIVLVGFEYQKFKVGYSYDMTISQLGNASGGAHEFSFTLKFECPRKPPKYKRIKCPAF